MTARHPDRRFRIVRDGASDASPSTNWLLASLPSTVLTHMAPHLERVALNRKQTLFRAHERLGHVYFPVTAARPSVSRSGDALGADEGWREIFRGDVSFVDVFAS